MTAPAATSALRIRSFEGEFLAITEFAETRAEIATKWLNYRAKKPLRQPWASIDVKLIDMALTGDIWRRLMS